MVRFEHHITETCKSIVKQPYNRREELVEIAKEVPNIAAKHEGGDPEADQCMDHPSDILDYFMPKADVLKNGLMEKFERNYMVVQGDLLVKVERQAEELARRSLTQARDLIEAGEVTRVDVRRAGADLAAAERALALAERDRGVAAGQLRVDLALDGELLVSEPTLDVPEPPGEAELLERAERARGDLQQAVIAVHVAQLEVSKQKGNYLPTITADAGNVWQKTAFPTDQYGYAALRFVVPIWQSGEISSRVTFARERERQARLALEEQLGTVQEDVRRTLLDLETAATSLALSEDQLRAAEAEYQQVADLYRSQEATSLDIQSSEANLNDARRGSW